MLFTKHRGQPDDRAGFRPGCVGDELAEVAVISCRELVLHDQDTVVGQVPPDEVKSEPAHRVFGRRQLDVEAERVGERVGVVEQPWGEVMGLVLPHITRVERLKPTKIGHLLLLLDSTGGLVGPGSPHALDPCLPRV